MGHESRSAQFGIIWIESSGAQFTIQDLTPFSGISLHVGEVMYGNVGTRQRLDFTVIGPAVNEAARLEGLCKALNKPVTISARFKDIFPGDLVSLGVHEVAGKKQGLEVFTLPEFVIADPAAE